MADTPNQSQESREESEYSEYQKALVFLSKQNGTEKSTTPTSQLNDIAAKETLFSLILDNQYFWSMYFVNRVRIIIVILR